MVTPLSLPYREPAPRLGSVPRPPAVPSLMRTTLDSYLRMTRTWSIFSALA